MSRLRTYARINARSQKVKDGAEAFKAVYAEVDARSEGRCEVTQLSGGEWAEHVLNTLVRCPKRGVHHHHLFQPRRSHHTVNEVIHVCAAMHDRMDWPYKRGRLCFIGHVGASFLFRVRYAASKFQARGQGE